MRTTGKKPTRDQKSFINKCKLKPEEWLVIKDTRHNDGKMLLRNKETQEFLEIVTGEE